MATNFEQTGVLGAAAFAATALANASGLVRDHIAAMRAHAAADRSCRGNLITGKHLSNGAMRVQANQHMVYGSRHMELSHTLCGNTWVLRSDLTAVVGVIPLAWYDPYTNKRSESLL